MTKCHRWDRGRDGQRPSRSTIYVGQNRSVDSNCRLSAQSILRQRCIKNLSTKRDSSTSRARVIGLNATDPFVVYFINEYRRSIVADARAAPSKRNTRNRSCYIENWVVDQIQAISRIPARVA